MAFPRRLSHATAIACSLLPWCTLACDRDRDEPSIDQTKPSLESSVEVAPPPTTRSTVEPDPAVAPEPAPSPSNFATAVATLVAGSPPSAAAETSAWTHYRAKQYLEAQRDFALASLHQPGDWKHPFNLACASALAGDEAMTRIALTEAIARDADAASRKARKDGDLAIYRSAAWFEAILGKQPVAAEPGTQPSDSTAKLVSPPLPDLAMPIPAGVAKPLTKAKLGGLRDQLRKTHGVRPTIRASLGVPTPTGEVAFVVYDYGLYDECRIDSDNELCQDILQGGEPTHDELANQTTCVDQWFVRVDLATSSVGTPQALAVSCAPNQVRRLDLVDIDGDGLPEIVLDTIAKTAVRGWTDSPMAYNRAREFSIFRMDGTQQFGLAMEADAELPFARHMRVFVRDANGDGHVDLIQQSLSEAYDCVDGSPDDDFWPTCPADEMPELVTETLLYDSASDTWVK